MPGMFGGYRVKKRTFAVAGIALLASLLTAGMFAVYAATLLGSGALVRFQLTEHNQNFSLPGSGISITAVQSRNLIDDGSFEPLVYRHFLTAYGGDEDSLTVSAEDAGGEIFGDGFFEGADIRVVGQTADGLALKKQGTVEKYGLDHVGVFQPVRMPADMPGDLRINALVRWQDQVAAAGSHGTVLYVEGNQVNALADVGIDADLTAICVADSGLLTVSDQGDVMSSGDGMVWQSWKVDERVRLNAVAARANGLVIAAGDDGKILVGADGVMMSVDTGTDADLNDILNIEKGWLAIGDEGTVLFSAGGLVWENISPDDTAGSWLTADAYGRKTFIAGESGMTAISENGFEFSILPVDDLSGISLVDLVMLSEQQFIALDSAGRFLISHDGGMTWTKSGVQTGMEAHTIILAGKDRLISADDTGRIGTAQLVAEIRLESSLYEGTYQSGDLVYLEMVPERSDLDILINRQDLLWQISANASAARIVDPDLPGTGNGCLELKSDKDAYISQEISQERLAGIQEGNVYRLNCWLKQDGVTQPVSVWITGLENEVGTRFNLPEGKWRQVSYSFVIPSAWIRQGENITINLGFEGGGILKVDDLSLIPAADEDYAYTGSFSEYIAKIKPSVIRLANIPLGRNKTPTWAWTLPTGHDTYVSTGAGWQLNKENSLSDGLKLVSDNQASPWLVLDSGISESEIAGLMEYLAAPVTEQYGRLRMQQGFPVPWSEAFDRIYFEISDLNGYFADDRLKAKYADWIIRQITLSPYYVNLKNQIIFVDGMNYEQGVMQSSADYHTSDFAASAQAANIYELEQMYLEYWQNKPRNPEKSLQSWPEIIRSFSLSDDVQKSEETAENVSLAELTSLFLYDLGGQTNIVMPEVDGTRLAAAYSDSQSAVLAEASSIVIRAADGEPYRVDRMTENDSVFVFATHSEGYFNAVICNLGDQPVNCHLAVETDLSDAKSIKYDAKAELIGTDRLRSNQSQITVLPGGVVCVEKPLS